MGWVSPTGFSDLSSTWTDETLAYDGNTGTYAYCSVIKGGWGNYLELTISAIQCDKVRGWFNQGISNISDFELDVYYGGAWHNIYNEEPLYGQFVEFPIGSTESVTGMRFRFYSSKAGSDGGQCYEAEFNQITGPQPGWNKLQYTSEPPTPNAWNQLKQEVGTGYKKLLYSGE